MTSERPKIDRNYYHSDEFKAKLERSTEAAANDTEYQKDLAAWNGVVMTPEQIIQLEADNLRLREALELFACRHSPKPFADGSLPDCCIATEALAQPAPTKGLLDVVRAVVKVAHEYEHDNHYELSTCDREYPVFEAVKALPPETVELFQRPQDTE